MAFCMNCGKQLPDGAKFCLECGTKLGNLNAEQATQRETTYEGKIYKCPNCGDILDAYESVCESCGYERRGTSATSSVQELSKKLQEIKSKKLSSAFMETMDGERSRSEEAANLIRSFPIPNAKEDLFEFAVMAASNFETDYWSMNSLQRTESDAWKSKFEQAYQKAKIIFGEDKEFLLLQSLYQQKMVDMKKGKSKNGFWLLVLILSLLIGPLLLLVLYQLLGL